MKHTLYTYKDVVTSVYDGDTLAKYGYGMKKIKKLILMIL